MKKMLTTLCLAGIASVATQAADKVVYEVSNDVPIDTFVVSNEISVQNRNNFGMNYSDKGYTHWIPIIKSNIWNRVGAFEPRVLVNWGLVEKGGDNSFVCDSKWALNAFGKLKSGFWDGAEVDVFSMKDGKYGLKRRSKLIKSVSGGSDVIDTYTLENDGSPALVSGDWVYLRKVSLKPSPHQQTLNRKGKPLRKNGTKDISLEVNMFKGTKWELVMDPCPEAGSTAAMKLTTTGKGGFWTFHTPGDKGKYNHWIEGEFKWEGWLKRSTPGEVTITLGGNRNPVVNKSFKVGTKWKKYEFDFNPMELFKNDNSRISKYQVFVSDSCDFYLDNIMMYKKGIKPFATYPEIIEKLKEFKPGIIRFSHHSFERRTIDSSLTKGISQAQEQDATTGSYSARIKPLTMVTDLELAKEVGTNPWVFVPPMMRLEDCDKFMEYFAAPANIGYGKKRASYGQIKPWTEEFSDIYIEIGNEQWGTNFSHCFPRKPMFYGRLAEMYISRMKASPYYDSKKFKFIINGFLHKSRGSWHEVVAKMSPSSDINDSGFYIGGWDGTTIQGDSLNSLYQSRMFNAPHVVRKERIEILRTDFYLGENIAKVLSEKPEIAKLALSYIEPSEKEDILASDMKQIINILMKEPIDALLEELLLTSKTAQKVLLKSLKIKKNVPNLSFLYKDVIKFAKKYPKEFVAFAKENNLDAVSKQAIMDISEGKRPKKTWLVYPRIKNKIKALIASEFKTNKKLIADTRLAVKKVNFFAAERKAVWQLFWNMGTIAKFESYDILTKVKSGEISLTEIHSNKDIFKKEVKVIAKKVANELKKQMNIYSEKDLNITTLDEISRKEMLDMLLKSIEKDDYSVERDSVVLILKVVKALVTKNVSEIDGLLTDPIFIEGLRRRILNQFGDTVIEAMIKDNKIAEGILFDYEKIPKDAKLGFKLSANYEAGPGYQLPGPGKKAIEEEELFGKSLALGLATLDGFMYDMERKFTYQNYFQFGFGDYWSTHTDPISYRRQPSYEALLMVNHYTSGNMMFVNDQSVKRIDIPLVTVTKLSNTGRRMESKLPGVKNVNIAKCYAFQDGKNHSFVLYNRSFTESRRVKLELPYKPSSKAVLYKLSAKSPTDTNRKELLVKQTKRKIDNFKNGYKVTLTPGEVLIINNNEK